MSRLSQALRLMCGWFMHFFSFPILVALFFLSPFLNNAIAEDTDIFFAPTHLHETPPAPLWLLIDGSLAMAPSLNAVKNSLLLWLASLPDTIIVGLAQVDRDGLKVLLTPQPLSAQRRDLITKLGALTTNGLLINSSKLIKTLESIPLPPSCWDEQVLFITSGQLQPSDPLIRLATLPFYLHVISVGFTDRTDLWRHWLQVDRERADFQQLTTINAMGEALTQAQSAFLNRQDLRLIDAIGIDNWSRVIDQSRLFAGAFQPSYRRQWLGNVKRFNLDLDGATSLAATTTLNESVYDGGAAQTLRQYPAARQRRVWTYTGGYQVSENTGWASLPAVGSDANLSAARNQLMWTANQNPSHDLRLQQLLQVHDADQAAQLIAWARGVDLWDKDSQTRRSMGAVVHSLPLIIRYGFDSQRYAQVPQDPDQRYESLLVGTQAGWLHALDAATQNELFSFMPQELLANLTVLQHQQSQGQRRSLSQQLHSQEVKITEKLSSQPPISPDPTSRFYGLDGSWQQWRYDSWLTDDQGKQYQDQQIDGNQGDHVYIVGGMRRGGYNYYGLDITAAHPQWQTTPNQLNARLQFVIHGGAFDHVPPNSPFRHMGQTWSEPKLAQIRLHDGVRAVWLFGGGYDAEYYDHTLTNPRQLPHQLIEKGAIAKQTLSPTTTAALPRKGSAMYMIDARSGALLWWAAQQGGDSQHPDLQHSIVASPKLLDLDADGLVDRVYWVDLGGQLFRQDIDNRQQSPLPSLSQRVRLQPLAKLGGEQTDDRRFFQTPSVAVLQDNVGQPRIVIALASSNHETPLDFQVQNRVVVLFDDPVLASSFSTRTFADLLLLDFNSSAGIPLTPQSTGWYWNLGQTADSRGEKVLAAPLILGNQLIINSLLPLAGGFENLCHAKRALPMQRLYVVHAQTGAATAALKHYADLGGSGRFRQYASERMMPASLSLLWSEGKPMGIIVGNDIYRFGQHFFLTDQPLTITKGWRRLQRQILPLP